MPKLSIPDWKRVAADVEADLWARRQQADGRVREELITLYMPFAKMLAAQQYAKRISAEVDFNEYVQLASLGLIDAVDRYLPEQGAQFTTYAEYRIVGTIQNELAGYTERNRQYAVQRRARERVVSLAEGDGKAGDPFARVAEVAIGLAIGMLLENEALCLQENEAAVSTSHYSNHELQQLHTCLQQLLERLPDKEQTVIRCHYLHQMDFVAIADLMQLSKGRISQLHSSALRHLREHAAAMRAADRAW
ncbi:sigma-70 family RNA polymerase sigma factor [Andreprevotia lacus]|nr:sigma-70 family RNA polymerase sigma factor [Andreprevotia lacus]